MMPGPGGYYGFGAGNYAPGARLNNNHNVLYDSRTLDDQWNNKSRSTKFHAQVNAQMGFTNLAMGKQVFSPPPNGFLKAGGYGNMMIKSQHTSMMSNQNH